VSWVRFDPKRFSMPSEGTKVWSACDQLYFAFIGKGIFKSWKNISLLGELKMTQPLWNQGGNKWPGKESLSQDVTKHDNSELCIPYYSTAQGIKSYLKRLAPFQTTGSKQEDNADNSTERH
jgi:hypothetical protein